MYTKTSVTDYIVRSFARKIRWTKNQAAPKGACYPLRDKTLGIIVCSKANRKSVDVASKYGISLVGFGDLHIDLDQVRRRVELAA